MLRRAFQNGFLLSSNYMWSHSINDGSIGGGDSDTPQNSFCRSCDKASSDFDVRHLFNLSTVYALPFGVGKKYLSSPGIARALLANWELSAIGTAQTGLPVNITIDRSNSSVPGLYAVSGSERPDYVAGASLTPSGGSTPNHWINAAAFAIPANGAFGNLGRNAFRAPGIAQLDLGLSKFVAITEQTEHPPARRPVQCDEPGAIRRPKRGCLGLELWHHHNDGQSLRNWAGHASRVAAIPENRVLTADHWPDLFRPESPAPAARGERIRLR